MNLYIKICEKCGRKYDYPRCPHCNWTEEQKEREKEEENGNR